MSESRRSSLATLYLVLAIIGYVVACTPMLIETFRTGNVLFWTQPTRTIAELFANRTSTAFALDAMAAAVVLCIWIVVESRRIGLAKPWRFVVLTLLFGLGGTLPLFLWFRDRALASRQAT